MDILKRWRESDWEEVDSAVYNEAYAQFGGSVITHPLVIETVSQMTGAPLRYLACHRGNGLVGAIPVWDKYIAGSKVFLRKKGKARIVDTGNAEVILPLSAELSFNLRFKSMYLSSLHQSNIENLKVGKGEALSFLKSYSGSVTPKFSKKFKYNQRRELRLFEDEGGYIKPVEDLDAQTFSDIYIHLFEKRWGKKPKGYASLPAFIESVRPLQQGSVLFSPNDQPVAIQLLLQADSLDWISTEYVNGGVDPEYKSRSVGSILSYINTFNASEYAESKDKPLRFSFGKSDKVYKDLWCYKSPVFCL